MLRIVIVITVLALLAIGGVTPAHAGLDGTKCGSNENTVYPGCDQGSALADCQTQLAALKARKPSANVTYGCSLESGDVNGGAYRCEVRDGLGPTWCGPTGAAPFYNFRGACAERASYFQGIDNNMNIAKVCSVGCEYKLTPTEEGSITSSAREPTSFAKGDMKPSGATCDSKTPPRKPPPGQACHESEGGHIFCKRDNGDICVTSATTGRTYCPKDPPTATNPKRTENVTKGPPGPIGNPPPIAPPTPRPGENWKPAASATINNVTNHNSSSITVNANAGSPNTNPGDGNPNDGSGNSGKPGKPGVPGDADGDDDGGGDGDGNNNTATGGGCTSGWATSGDAILGAILNEQNKQRCAGDKASKGFDDVAGTSLSDDGVLDGIWQNPGVGPSLNRNLISLGGGGSLLPSVTLEGQEWTVPESFFDAIAQIRLLIIAVCTIVAAFIVGRNI